MAIFFQIFLVLVIFFKAPSPCTITYSSKPSSCTRSLSHAHCRSENVPGGVTCSPVDCPEFFTISDIYFQKNTLFAVDLALQHLTVTYNNVTSCDEIFLDLHVNSTNKCLLGINIMELKTVYISSLQMHSSFQYSSLLDSNETRCQRKRARLQLLALSAACYSDVLKKH